jgi:transposase
LGAREFARQQGIPRFSLAWCRFGETHVPTATRTFHFTPTSASWLNAVEGFFAKLTNRRLKRGVFRSVTELQAAIERFLAETNSDPKPFLWPARPNRILAAVKRGKEKLESIH